MARGWTAQDVTRHNLHVQQARVPKYHNVKKIVDGIVFDSTKEAHRYRELVILQKAGAITALEVQPRYELIASNGEIIGHFTGDFRYLDAKTGTIVVEDVKAPPSRTTAYQLRKRLVRACHGITITEV
jgi:hypothetical protein